MNIFVASVLVCYIGATVVLSSPTKNDNRQLFILIPFPPVPNLTTEKPAEETTTERQEIQEIYSSSFHGEKDCGSK